jgi:hypothetical protein
VKNSPWIWGPDLLFKRDDVEMAVSTLLYLVRNSDDAEADALMELVVNTTLRARNRIGQDRKE